MEYTLSDEQLARLPNPREAIVVAEQYEKRVSAMLGLPVLADVDRIVTTIDWADGAQAIAAQPDVPRNITATLTDADNSLTGLMTVLGKDYKGRVISETMQPLGDGNGKTLIGTKIFAEITSITMTDTAGAAPGDAIVVGVGNVIGVPFDLLNASAVAFCWLDGVKLTPTVAIGESISGIDASAGTYDGAKWLHAIIQPSLAA